MKKSKCKMNTRQSDGFTLVELLVAISVLSLAILAAFTAVSNNIKGSSFSEDQIEANYLADEGVEFVRNLRDQNSINNLHSLSTGGASVNWLTGIAAAPSDPCGTNACVADSPLKTLAACTSSDPASCQYLRMDPTSGLFGYTSSWPVTRFRRSINVKVLSGTEARVTVTVYWTTNDVSKSYVVSELLEAWQ